jgi:hypothetical protein
MFATGRTAGLGGRTAILVRRGKKHYAVPLSGLQHPKTAIHLVLATRPVKLVAAYISRIRPVIASNLTECLSGGFPVLMAGDLNAKHTDWISRLITARGSLLRDYANRNSCLVRVPYSLTQIATPDVLHVVTVKDFVQPMHLSICSALRSAVYPDRHHMPIILSKPKTYWTAPTSREWTGVLSRIAVKTNSQGIPW